MREGVIRIGLAGAGWVTEHHLDAYATLRGRLAELASGEGTHFVDCSRAFDGEGATVFTDLWHFSDVGHRLLAGCLAAGLAPVVRARGARVAAGS